MSAPRFDDIAVCVFDAYGTLFDIAASAARARAAIGPKGDELIALWRQKQLEYSWLRSLMQRHADFWHVTGESLDYAMETLRVADPLLRSALMLDFLTPKLFPEVRPTLERLRQAGMKLAILSNGSPTMLTAACQHSGLDFLMDAVLSVERAGVYKPDPRVYALATDRFGVAPDAVAFLSANGWDAAGAAAFGFRVAWVNRRGAPHERLPAAPAVELADLSALPALLGL